MHHIFEMDDKTGRQIRLTTDSWKHIMREHPEVAPHTEELKEALKRPARIEDCAYERSVKYYYRYLKQKSSYLLVIVKYLNKHGFIITAYFVRSIK